MRSAAVIIGIDGYINRPLSSAVNDAEEFRRAVVGLGLVQQQEVTMVTSPRGNNQLEATRDNISNLMYSFYASSNPCDRLFFFYAGHGISAYSDPARKRTCTALMPSDVLDLNRDGSKLLNLDELQQFFKAAGPQEQIFFIDACRDLDYTEVPNVGVLGWSGGQLPGAARCQATLYAVSPLGKAEGAKGGLGRFTSHLVEALRSDTAAVDYDDATGQWVVTMHSLGDYVKWAAGQYLKNEPLYKKKYMIPQLVNPDPIATPIRMVDPVSKVPLSIHITPDNAAPQTQVRISLRGQLLDSECFPPRNNHDEVQLLPQRYRIEARSSGGSVEPTQSTVDLRREHSATIKVVQGGPVAPQPPKPPTKLARAVHPDTGPSSEFTTLTYHVEPVQAEPPDTQPPLGAGTEGMVKAEAADLQATIELNGLEMPYLRRTALWRLEERVPPGPYRISFRVGPKPFSEKEFYIGQGEELSVAPTVESSDLLRESLPMDSLHPAGALISESIGFIQADLLDTMLPIIGVEPFDLYNEFFRRFQDLVPKCDPHTLDLRPLSVVVAVDGSQWPVPPVEVLKSIRCRITSSASRHQLQHSPVELRFGALSPTPRWSSQLSPPSEHEPGLQRIGLAIEKAPAGSFSLHWECPYFGRFHLASAAVQNRATVVTLTVLPDGDVRFTQNVLRLPGRAYESLYLEEYGFEDHRVSYGRMLRELQLAQQLYRSGGLITTQIEVSGRLGTAARDSARGDLWRLQTIEQVVAAAERLSYAKWTDPILGHMAYFSLLRAREVEGTQGVLDSMHEIAGNLYNFFRELPDSRVIAGLENESQRDALFTEMIQGDQIPVLAEATRRLAYYAEEHEMGEAQVARIARSIPTGEAWTLTSTQLSQKWDVWQ